MSGTPFPLWNIGVANGIEVEYDVHWLDWDRAQLSVDGEEIVTFSSASAMGFTSEEGVLEEAADVALQLEDPYSWGIEDDEW